MCNKNKVLSFTIEYFVSVWCENVVSNMDFNLCLSLQTSSFTHPCSDWWANSIFSYASSEFLFSKITWKCEIFNVLRLRILCKLVIGAIIDIDNEEAEIAFKYAVNRENMYGAKFIMVPTIKVIDATNTFEVEQAGEWRFWAFLKICRLILYFHWNSSYNSQTSRKWVGLEKKKTNIRFRYCSSLVFLIIGSVFANEWNLPYRMSDCTWQVANMFFNLDVMH